MGALYSPLEKLRDKILLSLRQGTLVSFKGSLNHRTCCAIPIYWKYIVYAEFLGLFLQFWMRFVRYNYILILFADAYCFYHLWKKIVFFMKLRKVWTLQRHLLASMLKIALELFFGTRLPLRIE